MRKILNLFVSKSFIISLLILLQLAFFVGFVQMFSNYSPIINNIFIVLSWIIVVYVINGHQNSSYKITWVILILILPLFGGISYLLFGDRRVARGLRKQALISFQDANQLFQQNSSVLRNINKKDPHLAGQFVYLWRNSGFPATQNTCCKYYGLGEEMFVDILKDLNSATKFIFLEYFIIEDGWMWNSILAILQDKVNAGVEVRLMYDDAGCVQTLPNKYRKYLQTIGIKIKIFNPLRPLLAVQMNNRDHRKILVIDGDIGYTGGVNLADEYINKKLRFGHWKDGGVRLEGEGVYNLTVMFLQMYNLGFKKEEEFKFYQSQNCRISDDAVVCAFGDSPTDDEAVGESVHLNIINDAIDYLYMSTPYLILDQELTNALCLAAKRGVDVKIIVPHIFDKWYVMLVTKANYFKLVKNGVKIYEYTPGFMHHKTMIADDKICLIGTINMDFRSYFLHFECGVLLYHASCLVDLKRDLENSIMISQQIELASLERQNIIIRMAKAVLNILAPIM